MNLADKITNRSSYDQYYGRLKLVLDRPATKVSSLVILTIFTVIFFIVFAILPTFKTIAGLKREITDSKNIEAKLQQKIYSLNQAEELYGRVLPQLSAISRILPVEPELELLAWQIHWLSVKNNLTLVNATFDEARPDFVPVSLTLKGDYLAIRAFIADLNKLDRLIEAEELNISGKNLRSDNNALTATLKLKAYYLSGI